MSGFRTSMALAMAFASRRFSLWSFFPLLATLSISAGDNITKWHLRASFLISWANCLRLWGVRSFESFTPRAVSLGKSSSFRRTPAMARGPMMGPRPASSTPAMSILVAFFVCLLFLSLTVFVSVRLFF